MTGSVSPHKSLRGTKRHRPGDSTSGSLQATKRQSSRPRRAGSYEGSLESLNDLEIQNSYGESQDEDEGRDEERGSRTFSPGQKEKPKDSFRLGYKWIEDSTNWLDTMTHALTAEMYNANQYSLANSVQRDITCLVGWTDLLLDKFFEPGIKETMTQQRRAALEAKVRGKVETIRKKMKSAGQIVRVSGGRRWILTKEGKAAKLAFESKAHQASDSDSDSDETVDEAVGGTAEERAATKNKREAEQKKKREAEQRLQNCQVAIDALEEEDMDKMFQMVWGRVKSLPRLMKAFASIAQDELDDTLR